MLGKLVTKLHFVTSIEIFAPLSLATGGGGVTIHKPDATVHASLEEKPGNDSESLAHSFVAPTNVQEAAPA